jgi:hypothetical protein
MHACSLCKAPSDGEIKCVNPRISDCSPSKSFCLRAVFFNIRCLTWSLCGRDVSVKRGGILYADRKADSLSRPPLHVKQQEKTGPSILTVLVHISETNAPFIPVSTSLRWKAGKGAPQIKTASYQARLTKSYKCL